MSGNMTKIAVLDDWQGVARHSADWSGIEQKAQVTIFAEAFRDEDDAAEKLADFDIVLSMRERTPLPGSLINRLPKLRMLGMTGARNLSLVCRNFGAGRRGDRRETLLGTLQAAKHQLHRAALRIDAGRVRNRLHEGIEHGARIGTAADLGRHLYHHAQCGAVVGSCAAGEMLELGVRTAQVAQREQYAAERLVRSFRCRVIADPRLGEAFRHAEIGDLRLVDGGTVDLRKKGVAV